MKPRASRVPRRGCLLGILILAAAMSLAGAYLWMYMDYTGPTLVRRSPAGEAPAQSPYTLSAEQQQLVNQIGYPESFTLLFYQDLDEQDRFYDIRFECWEYAAARREVVFINGELISDEPAGSPGPDLVAAPYRPEQFAAAMSVKEILASTGITEYVRAAADPVLIPSGEVYLGKQLALGMRAGKLLAVETVALQAEG